MASDSDEKRKRKLEKGKDESELVYVYYDGKTYTLTRAEKRQFKSRRDRCGYTTYYKGQRNNGMLLCWLVARDRVNNGTPKSTISEVLERCAKRVRGCPPSNVFIRQDGIVKATRDSVILFFQGMKLMGRFVLEMEKDETVHVSDLRYLNLLMIASEKIPVLTVDDQPIDLKKIYEREKEHFQRNGPTPDVSAPEPGGGNFWLTPTTREDIFPGKRSEDAPGECLFAPC